MKLSLICLTLTLAAGLSAAACADSTPEAAVEDAGPDAATIPEPPPANDAGCEGGDACSPVAIDCSQAAFCPVQTGADPRFSLTSVWGSSRTDVWVVGSAGAILHYDGTSWQKTPAMMKQTLYAVGGRGSGDVWAISSREFALQSSGFAGANTKWIPATPLAPRYVRDSSVAKENALLAVWMNTEREVWIGGEPYPVYTDEERTTWRNMNFWRRRAADSEWQSGSIADNFVVRAFWSGGADDVWAVGGASGDRLDRSGRTFHSTTTGGDLTWTEFDSQATTELHALWGSGPNDVWAVGNDGTVRHWTNGTPKRWEIAAVPTKNDLRSVWGSGPSDVWAVGDFGTILHYDGAAWTKVVSAFPPNLVPHLRGVWGSGADDVWIVGDSVVLHSTGKAGKQ